MGSTLTPENLPAGPDRRIHLGHGTAALGPSDSSDSGSDMQGLPGIARPAGGDDLSEPEAEGDSDAAGTGERSAAEGGAAPVDGDDIGTDHVERIAPQDDAPAR
jgi:hypothetical protein